MIDYIENWTFSLYSVYNVTNGIYYESFLLELYHLVEFVTFVTLVRVCNFVY